MKNNLLGYKILMLFIGFVFTQTQSYAQVPVIFNIGCADGEYGEISCIDVTVENFDNILSYQGAITYNANVIVVTSIEVTNSCLASLTSGEFNLNDTLIGCIPNLWADLDGLARTCPDGAVLFTICYRYIGEPGECTIIDYNATCGIEVALDNEDGEVPLEVNKCENCVTTNELTIVYDYCETNPDSIDNGKIKFYVIGGVEPYNVMITSNGGFMSDTILNDKEVWENCDLPSAGYTIKVTDASGNMTTAFINITENFPLEYDISSIDPTCPSKDNGSAGIGNIMGGQNPYQIDWSTGANNIGEIEDLFVGDYTVTVTDANGCELEKIVSLSVDTIKIDINIVTPMYCEGDEGAKVIFTATGGTPENGTDYDWFLNGFREGQGATLCATGPGFVLFPNDNQIIALDNSVPRCSSEVFTFDIPVLNQMTIIQDLIQNVTCKGFDDGRIRVTASVGTETNFFLKCEDISNGTNMGGTASSDFFFHDSLPAGSYRIVAISNNFGCIDTFLFDITEPLEDLVLDSLVSYPSCTGNDGEITITPMGGTPGYSYDWGPTINMDIDMLSGLNGGDFKVVVTDDGGCMDSLSFSLPDGGDLIINADILTTVSCKGDTDGSVIVQVMPAGDYTYEWTDASNNVLGIDPILENIGTGWYYVTASASGCTAIDSVFVLDPAGMVFVDVIVTDPECKDQTGSIGVVVNGGFPSYNFIWTEKNSTLVLGIQSVLTPIPAGEYCVTVSDQAGCTIDTCAIMINPAGIDIQVASIVGVGCSGQDSGEAMASASGGSQGATTFNFLWSSGEVGAQASMLAAGPAWVIASDTKCASDTFFFNVPDAAPVGGGVMFTTPSCAEDCDATISITPSGGTGTGYNVNWPQLGIDALMVDGLCPNTYEYIITDSQDCDFSGTVVINAPDTLELDLNPALTRDVSCRSNTGTIATTVFGGNGNYIYTWTNDVSDMAIAQSVPPGTYTVIVTDEKGCTDEVTYTLDPALLVFATVPTPIEPNCFGDLTCISVLNPFGGVGEPYKFQVNSGPLIPIDSCVNVFAGDYTINVFDETGCSFDTTITIFQPDPITVEIGDDIEVKIGEKSETIIAQIDNDFPRDSISWTMLDPFDCLQDDCEEIVVTAIQDQMVTVYVEDINGCFDTDNLMIRINDIREVYFPNIFSPDNNGVNDRFQPTIGPGIEIINTMIIYDRWGNKMFQQDDYLPGATLNDGWDGTFNGDDVDSGVYVYYVNVTFKDGRTLKYAGDITIVR